MTQVKKQPSLLLSRIVFIGLFACFQAFALHVDARAQTTEPDLTAHEWGTFTSVAGNDGNAVEWMPLSGAWPGSDLPGFVEHFGFAGFKTGLRGTIRMETPVLYFYSPHDLTVSVQVAFSKGLITEWYPHAGGVSSAGELTGKSLYQNNLNGTISWNPVHLRPGSSPDFPREQKDSPYYEARQTSAAPLSIDAPKGEQHEKFLFYRGVSSASVPIAARLLPDGSLLATNLTQEEIPNLILFERRAGKIGYRMSNGLQTHATMEPVQLTANIYSLYGDLEQTLVARGLYRDEAHAMVQTWKTSWFEEGSRLLYIVPSSFVDAILPLAINPQPMKTIRVFVGRVELVTPATQEAVETALASHDQKTLDEYNRFLEPILRVMTENNPAKQRRIQELMGGCE